MRAGPAYGLVQAIIILWLVLCPLFVTVCASVIVSPGGQFSFVGGECRVRRENSFTLSGTGKILKQS